MHVAHASYDSRRSFAAHASSGFTKGSLSIMVAPRKRLRFLELVALSFWVGGSNGCWVAPGSAPLGSERQQVLTVETYYPGATPNEVLDAVATPIEQRIRGIKKLVRIRSHAAADGTYVLEAYFAQGYDLEQAFKLVQDRLAEAFPALPVPVSNEDAKLLRPKPSNALAIITLSSPDGRRDQQYLRIYAERLRENELARLPGVYHLQLFGGANVPRVERGDVSRSLSTFNGRPTIGIAVFTNRGNLAGDVSKSLRTNFAQIKAAIPESVRLELDFDFAPNIDTPLDRMTPEYLLIEVHFPATDSLNRMAQMLVRCEVTLRDIAGVQDVLASTEPFLEPGQFPACVLVRLAAPGTRKMPRDQLVAEIRSGLQNAVKDSLIRVRDLAGHSRFPACSWPIELAVVDTENRGYGTLHELASRLAEKLRESPGMVDAMASPGPVALEAVSIEVDVKKADSQRVVQSELTSTLELLFAGRVSELDVGSGTFRLKAGPLRSGREIEDLSTLKTRASDSRMVQLSDVAQIRRIPYTRLLERLDGLPMVSITSDFSADLTSARARDDCARIIKEFDLPAAYRVRWLTEDRAPEF